MATEKEIKKEIKEKINENRFARSPEESQDDDKRAAEAIYQAKLEIREVIQILLDHTSQAVGYLFSDKNTFHGELIVDWSLENAEKYLAEREEKEKKLYAGEMGSQEAAEFGKRWISYIQHGMYRRLLRIYMPEQVTDEEFEAVFPELCREENEREEQERVEERCRELYDVHKGENMMLDGDSTFEKIIERADKYIERAENKRKRKEGRKEQA